MMFMKTYILNVRIALTPKAITVSCFMCRSFFFFSVLIFHFLLSTFRTLYRIRNAVRMAFVPFCDGKKNSEYKWNGVVHISQFHLFTGALVSLAKHSHTQSLGKSHTICYSSQGTNSAF